MRGAPSWPPAIPADPAQPENPAPPGLPAGRFSETDRQTDGRHGHCGQRGVGFWRSTRSVGSLQSRTFPFVLSIVLFCLELPLPHPPTPVWRPSHTHLVPLEARAVRLVGRSEAVGCYPSSRPSGRTLHTPLVCQSVISSGSTVVHGTCIGSCRSMARIASRTSTATSTPGGPSTEFSRWDALPKGFGRTSPRAAETRRVEQ